MLLDQLLYGVLTPALIALVVLAIGWASARKPAQARVRVAWGALAVPAAFAVAYWLTLGWPALPPGDTTRWLPYAALLGLVLGLLAAPPKMPWWLTALLRLAASVALPLAILQPTIQSTWHSAAGLWIGGLALALFIFWTAADAAAQRLPGPPMPLALGAAAALLAVALLLGRSAMLAQAGGMLAAAVGAAFLVALWRPTLLLAIGALPGYMLVYGGLLLCGHFYAEVPALPAALLALAPAAPILAAGIPPKRKALRAVMALLLVLALAGTAVGLMYYEESAAEAGAAGGQETEFVY